MKEIEYKRLVSKRQTQYLKPRKCRNEPNDTLPLKYLGVNRGHSSHSGQSNVRLLVAKSGWKNCRFYVMNLFKYFLRDDVVKVVVGKSRFDSDRSPVPYRTQSVLVSNFSF